MKVTARTLPVLILLLPALPALAQPVIHIEEDGLVVLEAESGATVEGWTFDTRVDGHTGEGYIEWTGPDRFPLASAGYGRREYHVRITTPGNYEFRFRSRIMLGDSNTDHNDSYVRFPSGQDVEGEVALDGWTKAYMNAFDQWAWPTHTVDHQHRKLRQYFEAGDHLVELSARSKGHAIDRFVLYRYADVDFNGRAFELAAVSDTTTDGTTDGADEAGGTSDGGEEATDGGTDGDTDEGSGGEEAGGSDASGEDTGGEDSGTDGGDGDGDGASGTGDGGTSGDGAADGQDDGGTGDGAGGETAGDGGGNDGGEDSGETDGSADGASEIAEHPVGECFDERLVLAATRDAHTDGSGFEDGDVVRVVPGERRGLFAFDLAGLPPIDSAELWLASDDKAGDGVLRAYLGSRSNWPESGSDGGSVNSMVEIGAVDDRRFPDLHVLPLERGLLSPGGLATIVLERDVGGEAIAFHSSESDKIGPRLVVEGYPGFCAAYVPPASGTTDGEDAGTSDGGDGGGSSGESDGGADSGSGGESGGADAGGGESSGGSTADGGTLTDGGSGTAGDGGTDTGSGGRDDGGASDGGDGSTRAPAAAKTGSGGGATGWITLLALLGAIGRRARTARRIA